MHRASFGIGSSITGVNVESIGQIKPILVLRQPIDSSPTRLMTYRGIPYHSDAVATCCSLGLNGTSIETLNTRSPDPIAARLRLYRQSLLRVPSYKLFIYNCSKKYRIKRAKSSAPVGSLKKFRSSKRTINVDNEQGVTSLGRQKIYSN